LTGSLTWIGDVHLLRLGSYGRHGGGGATQTQKKKKWRHQDLRVTWSLRHQGSLHKITANTPITCATGEPKMRWHK